MKKITLCGDDCLECPRYLARTEEELKKAAELWYRIGWTNKIEPIDKIQCTGCSSHKRCTYQLVECVREHQTEKCNQCHEFPCEKIDNMLRRSSEYKKIVKTICSPEEYSMLEKAFFNKEENLKK